LLKKELRKRKVSTEIKEEYKEESGQHCRR